MPSPALLFRRNVYSQNGEDGILRELLNRLPSPTNWVCEFGVLDGKEYSNTFRLIEQKGYNAVYIESDSENYNQLLNLCKKYPTILPIHKKVEYDSEDTLDNILSTTPIPTEFDILSIDIDSSDYQVWRSVEKYSPKIIVIEINSSISPDVTDYIYEENGTKIGTSFLPMVNLGISKGYTLICHTGNLIFVKNDIAHLYSDLIVPPKECYISNWIFI